MVESTERPMTEHAQQPWVHDLVLVLAAPSQAWSASDGQIRESGVQGLLHGDRRLVRQVLVTFDGEEPTPVAHYAEDGDVHTFTGVPRHLGDPVPDPTVRVLRRRKLEPGLLHEQVTLTSTASRVVRTTLTIRVTADLAGLDVVKAGDRTLPATPLLPGGTVATYAGGGVRCSLRAHGAELSVDGDTLSFSWELEVAPGREVRRELLVAVEEDAPLFVAPTSPVSWERFAVESADRRLAPVLSQALSDLRLLRLAPADAPEESFVGAGAPWFLTLFGRDSLWAARMLLPLGTELAGSTLRLLARHQGVRSDVDTAEQPGKILHEVRGSSFWLGDDDGVDRALPPVYYGTIDATPLWALTLHDAWTWGLDPGQVEKLVPALHQCLVWMVEHGDADGDHLLEYLDASGHGLSNQGWKDSGDSIRRIDGSLARPPVALSEVQGYAYAAAVRGADLLEAFGVAGTDRWRSWAEELRAEFHRRYWVEDAVGPFPAIALDGDKRPVVSLTSNIGHLLGTGLLDGGQVDAVARRLVAPDMLSGFGVRTLSQSAAGYSPTGYHVGSVWPHDTAICLAGLAAEGRPEVVPVGEALLAALHAFEGRPPELFAGDARNEHAVPLPYPAACRPQAWAAASAVVLLTSMLGLAPLADGTVAINPRQPWPWGATRVDGVRLGDRAMTLQVHGDGTVERPSLQG